MCHYVTHKKFSTTTTTIKIAGSKLKLSLLRNVISDPADLKLIAK